MTAGILSAGGVRNQLLGLPTRSIDFEDGSSQYLSMTPTNWGWSSFDRQKFLISAWVKHETALGDKTIIAKDGSSARGFAFGFSFNSPNYRIRFRAWDGTNIIGEKLSTGGYNSTSGFYHIAAIWNTADTTAADRMQVWVNGGRVSLFDVSTDPALNESIGSTSSGTVTVGAQNSGSIGNFYDGLIYQAAVYSGNYPSVAQLYNSGVPVDLRNFLPGNLQSLLSVRGGDVTYDEKRATAWTNNGTATASTTIP